MSDGDWPHDPDGDAGSEGRRKYGMAIVAKKVDDEADFPLAVEDFLAEHGKDPVRINHERVVPLAELFEGVDDERFETITDMHRAVGDAMRAGDYWAYHPGQGGTGRSES